MRIGWIGLGTMGLPMAANLIKAGHELTVYNRTEAKAAPLLERGAKWAPNPAAAAVEADWIGTIVSGPDDVREVILGAGGVLTGASSGSTIIDFSTIGPDAAQELDEACSSAGVTFLACPVTGSRPAAEAGTLTLLLGGPKEAREFCEPALKVVGPKIVALDTPAKAQALKLCMNQTFASTVHALVEGATLAEKSGVGIDTYLKGVEASLVANQLFEIKGQNLRSSHYDQIFSLALMSKDLELAGEFSRDAGAYLPMAATLRELYRAGLLAGLGNKDYVATALLLKSLNSLKSES